MYQFFFWKNSKKKSENKTKNEDRNLITEESVHTTNFINRWAGDEKKNEMLNKNSNLNRNSHSYRRKTINVENKKQFRKRRNLLFTSKDVKPAYISKIRNGEISTNLYIFFHNRQQTEWPDDIGKCKYVDVSLLIRQVSDMTNKNNTPTLEIRSERPTKTQPSEWRD